MIRIERTAALALLLSSITACGDAPLEPPSARLAALDDPSHAALEFDDPTTTTEMGPVNVGSDHACALRANGSAACWTYSPYGQNAVPASERFTHISAGFATSCGLRANGTIGCYGSDGSGQTNVVPGTYTQVSVGSYDVCGLRTDATIACWGGGTGSLMPAGTYKEISVGHIYICGIQTNGSLECRWPSYIGGSPPPAGNFLRVSAGAGLGAHSCAIRADRSIACWGSNEHGQLAGIPTSRDFRQIAVGSAAACALRESGEIVCWGNPVFGLTTPPQGQFEFLSVGSYHACAKRVSGGLVCWGDSNNGKLNIPADLADNHAPVASAGADRTVELSGSPTANVPLDGSGSTDDGMPQALTYTWTEGGTQIATGATPTVTLGIGTHLITLTASDGQLQASDDLVITVVDPTPPQIAVTIDGDLGNNQWYRSSVTVRFIVTELESTVTTPPCVDVLVQEDTPGTMATCSAASAGGTEQVSRAIRRDATIPAVAFAGATTYDVDQDVAISCTAVDPAPGSGLMSSSCPSVTAPGYTVGVGAHTLSASAEDNAGNAASAQFTFTIRVTNESLCVLVGRWVQGNGADGVVNSLCQKLRSGARDAFANELRAQTGKRITSGRAAILIELSDVP